MITIQEGLKAFRDVASNPRCQLDRYIDAGKKVIGIGPYYVPEELVYAAGAIPFGIWGAVGTAVEAKKYFPPFYCSICQMSLEQGLTHKLDKLSGIMITGLCDTLKAFSQNWKAGVETVPLIFVSQPQNRSNEVGRAYAVSSYHEVAHQVEECCGAIIENETLRQAITLYNDWRFEMQCFISLAGSHPREVSVADRSAVIEASYFMDKAEHLTAVRDLNCLLEKSPSSTDGFRKIMLSGIYEDIPAISEILDDEGFCIVGDDLAKESRAFSLHVPELEDPIEALAEGFCNLKEDSILFDPGKTHADKVARIAKQQDAQGVVLLLAKFCDPEEFDAPFVRNACKEKGLPVVTIEIDQSTESYEQARTQLETFAELLA